jgi:hypothetical protein
MMAPKKEIIVPAQEAVFWLDKNGRWHNRHGLFQHPKIIARFHASIRKDENGYHLFQATDEVSEKVYFHYEDTALFVFNVIDTHPVKLVLNTTDEIDLNPRHLFIQNDNLYLDHVGERVKFEARALMKLSPYLYFENERNYIQIDDRIIPIPVRASQPDFSNHF